MEVAARGTSVSQLYSQKNLMRYHYQSDVFRPSHKLNEESEEAGEMRRPRCDTIRSVLFPVDLLPDTLVQE